MLSPWKRLNPRANICDIISNLKEISFILGKETYPWYPIPNVQYSHIQPSCRNSNSPNSEAQPVKAQDVASRSPIPA